MPPMIDTAIVAPRQIATAGDVSTLDASKKEIGSGLKVAVLNYCNFSAFRSARRSGCDGAAKYCGVASVEMGRSR
jgi:hypothetical protein